MPRMVPVDKSEGKAKGIITQKGNRYVIHHIPRLQTRAPMSKRIPDPKFGDKIVANLVFNYP